MSDLTEFLLTRIAEDERRAPAEHYAPFEREWEWCPAALTEPFGDHLPGPCDCNCPKARARWLAECEAKRHIVAEHEVAEWMVQGHPVCETCVSPDDWNVTEMPMHLVYPCRTLRHLAAVYADHPDHRDEWKP